MRKVALIAMLVGAAGSLGLLLHASERRQIFLTILFVGWVLAPFVALLWANRASKRWSTLTQSTLYWITLVVALGSLAIYADDAVSHRAAHPAFVWVAVPPVSWLLITMALGIAAFISRGRSAK